MASLVPRNIVAFGRWSLLVTTVLLVAFPFLSVTIPPAVDLPQHLGQVRMFYEALAGQRPDLTIAYLAPGNLVYLLLAACDALLSPFAAGRLALALVVLAGVQSAWAVATRRDRPMGAVVLTAALAFNHSLYWGFLPFLCGWPVFLVWVHVLPTARTGVLAALALLLYAAHPLWFAVGAICALPGTRHLGWKRAGGRGLALLLPLALAALWYPTLTRLRSEAGFDMTAHFFTSPVERLDPRYLVDALLGGIRGPTETVVLAAMACWLVGAVVAARRGGAVDRHLLLASGLLWAIAFLGPDKFANTLEFNGRFFPPAMALLLLALPAPRLSPGLANLGAVVILLALSAVTALSWVRFEAEDLGGLKEAVEAVPEGSRVLGLDLRKQSAIVKGRPFIQAAYWVQAARGARPYFSFAEHGVGLVSCRIRPSGPTPGLEWSSELVKPSDFKYFDHVIANGSEEVHKALLLTFGLEAVTYQGAFRLYRVPSMPNPGGESLGFRP